MLDFFDCIEVADGDSRNALKAPRLHIQRGIRHAVGANIDPLEPQAALELKGIDACEVEGNQA